MGENMTIRKLLAASFLPAALLFGATAALADQSLTFQRQTA